MKKELVYFKNEIIEECIKTKSGQEQLCILSAGDDPASNIYMQNKVNFGQTISIPTQHTICSSPDELEKNIIKCNNDDTITGIIVQLPLPQGYDTKYFINLISPEKDVDMLTDINKAKMFLGQTNLLPATASGIIFVLDKQYGLKNLEGKDVVLIGRSDLVNLPLQKALLDLNCTVTLCHSKTTNLAFKCRHANIIISAAGKHGLITPSHVGEFTELILDVSINRINGKIKGDVMDEVYDLVDVTANPKGLGVLTVPMLFLNLIQMTKMQKTNN